MLTEGKRNGPEKITRVLFIDTFEQFAERISRSGPFGFPYVTGCRRNTPITDSRSRNDAAFFTRPNRSKRANDLYNVSRWSDRLSRRLLTRTPKSYLEPGRTEPTSIPTVLRGRLTVRRLPAESERNYRDFVTFGLP